MTDDALVEVIDDDEAVRDSVEFMLDAAGLGVRTWDSAKHFLEAGPANGRCIVTDVRMPDMTGLDIVRALRARGVATPVIVITGHADVPLAVEAMKAGVVDFIEKPFENQRLLGAIRAALAAGGTRPAGDGPADEQRRQMLERLEGLSQRERQVLDGLVAGHANKVIAYDLGISPRTVEIYRANVMTKMQARSLSELVRMAIVADPARGALG
jgi:two-component system response regulator FixJ